MKNNNKIFKNQKYFFKNHFYKKNIKKSDQDAFEE